MLLLFIIIQFKRPSVINPRVTGDINAPEYVKTILRRGCYDCHSNETNLRWYDKIAPVYWQVAEDVRAGREVMNFSEWDKLAPADQKAKLWECINQINTDAMPLQDYALAHRSAKISATDLSLLRNYLLSITDNNSMDTAGKQDTLPHPLPTAINGIAFIPGYKNWQPISTTDRFDNGTIRVIFGNDVAIRAIRNHRVNPWPDGTILAKAAWGEATDEQGNAFTGAFKQVEYMIKDKEKYASTQGWGFARFKTPQLVPYGKSISFTNECINCHRPVSDNDFVFTQPIAIE